MASVAFLTIDVSLLSDHVIDIFDTDPGEGSLSRIEDADYAFSSLEVTAPAHAADSVLLLLAAENDRWLGLKDVISSEEHLKVGGRTRDEMLPINKSDQVLTKWVLLAPQRWT